MKKLKLENLEINSFRTVEIDENSTKTVKGGTGGSIVVVCPTFQIGTDESAIHFCTGTLVNGTGGDSLVVFCTN